MRRLFPSKLCLHLTLLFCTLTLTIQAYSVPNNRVTCWTETFGGPNVASYLDSSLEIHEPGSCKIEINSQKASGNNVLESNHKTKVYCKSYGSGAPYFDRFNQHFILVIYTTSGFISKTRLVQNRDKRLLAEGEIDIDELDFDFNKYSHENFYFKIYLESFDGQDNGINSEDSNDFGEGTDNEFSSEEYLDTNVVTGDYLKTFINKQFNIDSINDLVSSSDPVCSGQIHMASKNENLFTADHLVSPYQDTNKTEDSLHYIGNGYFFSTNSNDATANRLFYSHPYGARTFIGQNSKDFDLFKNGLQEIKFDSQTAGNKITDVSKISLVVADSTADYSIRTQNSLSILAIVEDGSGGQGLLEYDLQSQNWTSIADNTVIDSANTEFVPLSLADSAFFDQTNSPVRFLINKNSKKLYLYEHSKTGNEITAFDLASLFSLTDDIEVASASILDGIVTIATKNSGTDDITFIQYYVDYNAGSIIAMYPSVVLKTIAAASGYTISHLQYMSPTLLVAVDTNGKLYYSNDHGLHFKEVSLSTYAASIISLPFKNLIQNPDSPDVLYLLDQNNQVFFWRNNLENVISTDFTLPGTCASNVILDTHSQAKIFCQVLFSGSDQTTPNGYDDNYQWYWQISTSKEILNENFIYESTDEISNKPDSCNIDTTSVIQDSYLKEDMVMLTSDLFLSPINSVSDESFDGSALNLGFKIHTELVSRETILPQYSFYQNYGAKQAGININSYISYRDSVAYRASRSSMTASIEIPDEYSNSGSYQPIIVYKAVNVNANILCQQKSYRIVIKNTKKSSFNHPALYDTSYDRIGHVSYSQSGQIDSAAEYNDNPNFIDGLRPIDVINPNHMNQKFLKNLEAGYQPPSLYGISSATTTNFYNSDVAVTNNGKFLSKVPDAAIMSYKINNADLSCSIDTQEKQLSENPNYNHCREKTFTKAFFMEYVEDSNENKNCMRLPVEMRDMITGDYQGLSSNYLVYVREINNRQANFEWDINNDSTDLSELVSGSVLIPGAFLKNVIESILNWCAKLWWLNWLPRFIVKSNNFHTCSYSDNASILQSHIEAYPEIRTNATKTRFENFYNSADYQAKYIGMTNNTVEIQDDQIFQANDLRVKLLQPGLYHFEILVLDLFDDNAPVEVLYSQIYKRQEESKHFWKQGPGTFGTLLWQLIAHFIFVTFIFSYFIKQTFYDPTSEHKVVIDDDTNDAEGGENQSTAGAQENNDESFNENTFAEDFEKDYDAKLARTNLKGGKPQSAKHGMAQVAGVDNV